MSTTTITIRTDEEIKQQANELFADLGLDMSGAINVFLRAAIREGGIPFAVSTLPDAEYRAWMKQELAKSFELAQDPNTRRYTVDEVKKDLGLNP